MAFQLRLFTMLAIVALMTWTLISEAQAQVTFSRDWNPGKRAENPELRSAMKTASAVCHLLMSQMRQLSSCDNRDDIDTGTSTIFTGRR